jgi:predicted nucleotidyltransferase component of viral defense system
LRLIDEIRVHGVDDPFWTFGGGTVLMLRYRHRRSKDIDIFVPDPQYLGYVSPRLSELAEEITTDFVEGAGFVKLIRPEGEIDFVASPNLTTTPFETWSLQRRPVRVETAAEIVAKKLWHRGDNVSARDLFDLSLVIEREPDSLRSAARFLVRHRESFTEQLGVRAAVLRAQFEAIDALTYRPTFDEAAVRAARFLARLPSA